jgi:hypothetical protein
MAAIIALAPLVLELIKLLFGRGGNDAAVKQAEEALKRTIQEIRAAVAKAEETGGNTEDLESIINRPKKK